MAEDSIEKLIAEVEDKTQKVNAVVRQVEEPDTPYHFIKSNYFRVCHVDGAWGGTTPQLNIHAAFFNERPAIPQLIRETTDGQGNPKREIVGRDGYVREVEVEIVMSIKTAKKLRDWLDERIAHAELVRSEASKLAQEGEEIPDIVITNPNRQSKSKSQEDAL